MVNGIAGHTAGLNEVQSTTRSQIYEEIEHENEQEDRMSSDNIAYHSNQRVNNQSVVLIQQLPTIPNGEENYYEYIL